MLCFPVLTSELDVKTPAENAASGETTGAFSADVLTPGRLQASFFYSREDRAQVRRYGRIPTGESEHGPMDGLDAANHRRH